MAEKPLIIKRNIKYPRIELKTGNLVLILPRQQKISPQELLQKHRKWIERKQNFIEEIKAEYKGKRIIKRNSQSFLKLVEKFVKEGERKLKVKVSKIRFRLMKTKWASFSKKRKIINLNVLTKFLPARLIKYIIFHEITHSLFPKHNKNFWLCIQKEFPNYQDYEKNLLGHWFLIQGISKNKKFLEKLNKSRELIAK